MADADLKQRFLNLFGNLPINVRKEVILVIENAGRKQPITWNVAYNEISNDTSLGKKILEGLNRLSLI